MRVVLLLPKLHAGAELALNNLIVQEDLNIVGIIRSDVSPFKMKYWRYINKGVKAAGLFYGLLIGLLAYAHRFAVLVSRVTHGFRKSKWQTIDQIVETHNLKLYDTENINSAETIKVLKGLEPDIMVTVYFDQILKKEAIAIPKVAALNMHPGLLPRYRGIWPEFWKMYNGDKYAGISIHHLTEGIDQGDVIAQKRFPILKSDTKFGLGLKSAIHGTKLLGKTLGRIKKGRKLRPLKLISKARYYSLPKKQDFRKFFAKGKRLFSFGRLFNQHQDLF